MTANIWCQELRIKTECEDRKPVVARQIMVGQSSTSRVSHAQGGSLGETRLALRVPVDSNFHNAMSYRVVPLKVDSSMETLSESEGSVPVTPILATHLTSESIEPRLALIAASETSNESNPTVVVSGGQVFVISDPTNVSSGTRAFIPRTTDTILNQRMSSTREDKRRLTHNEVERRRRDKINSWICRLAKILPEGSDIQSKTSQVSKGGILAKACDYIEELRKQVRTLSERLKVAEMEQKNAEQIMLKQELEVLKRENDAIKNENALFESEISVLKLRMHQHGILDELGS